MLKHILVLAATVLAASQAEILDTLPNLMEVANELAPALKNLSVKGTGLTSDLEKVGEDVEFFEEPEIAPLAA